MVCELAHGAAIHSNAISKYFIIILVMNPFAAKLTKNHHLLKSRNDLDIETPIRNHSTHTS